MIEPNVKAQGMDALADIPCRYWFDGFGPKAGNIVGDHDR